MKTKNAHFSARHYLLLTVFGVVASALWAFATPFSYDPTFIELTIGNYPNTMVAVGANTTVTPDAAPTDATSINVATDSNFKGTFVADPATGVVRVTNAHPAGSYTVTVTAFDAGGMTTTQTFTLTVISGTVCNPVQFTNAADVSVGSLPLSVAIGDFNNDGNQDVATANRNTDTVSIRLGNGVGGFSGTTNVSVGSGPFSVAIGDFNNDGNQDFASANQFADTVSIRLGDGLGNFNGTTNVSVGTTPVSVALGDFNNDGKQDVATANFNANTVSVRLGNGLGGFSGATNVSVGTNPQSVAIGDFNNDGKQDFASANNDFASATDPDTVSIRLGDGLGGFSGTTNVSVGDLPGSVAIGDFNNDGKQDFASANGGGSATVSIRLGDGLGGFSGTTEVSVAAASGSVAIGDFNNDGFQDFAANSGNLVSIRLGDGLGGFSGTTNVSVGTAPASVAIGDFNNDGNQDFATANQNANTASIRLGGCLGTPTPTTLANISTRLRVETGDNVLIGGFIITGTQPKKVLLRAIGPSLPVPGALADPNLELFNSSGQTITSNDNWMDAPNRQEIIDSTIPPANDLESAILMDISPGAYTAIVSGVNNTTGVGLVEAYDLDLTVDSILANISTRGLVQTGDNVMIGGFIVLGTDMQRVIVRAIGPSLPVAGRLADPALELYDGNGTLLISNNNWRDTQEAEIIATTIPPTDDAESAIVQTLPPAAYTAIVRGVNNTTGVGLVEVYALAP